MLRLLARHLRRPAPAADAAAEPSVPPAVTDGVLDGLPLRLGTPVGDGLAELFAAERAREDAAPVIVLLDATGARGARVAVALGRQQGEPVERVLVQVAPDDRTVAEVHRVVTQDGRGGRVGLLQVEAHAAQPQGREAALALLGQADMAVLIADPAAGGALLDELLEIAQEGHWRCPALLLMLPPGAAGEAATWRSQPWPLRLQVQVVSEALADADGVWQRVRQHWDGLRAPRQRIFQALMDVTLAGTAPTLTDVADPLPPISAADLEPRRHGALTPPTVEPPEAPAFVALPPLRPDELDAPGVLAPVGLPAAAPADLFPGSLPAIAPALQVTVIALARERGVLAAWLVDAPGSRLLESAGALDGADDWRQALAWWSARPEGVPAPRHLALDLGERALLWWPLPATPARALCLMVAPRHADLAALSWQVEVALGQPVAG